MSGEVFSFSVHLEPAGDQPVRVLARIKVLRTEDGGRASPFTKNFRPNHNFGGPTIDLSSDKLRFLRELGYTQGKLTSRDCIPKRAGLAENLAVGRVWRIQEGGRYIASAEVLSLLTEA